MNSIPNKITSFLSTLIDLIFPARCVICKKRDNDLLCEECIKKINFISPPYCQRCGKKAKGVIVENSICGECRTAEPPFCYARAVGEYEGVLKSAIHYFKYKKKKQLKIPFAKIILEYLKNCDIKEIFSQIEMIIPVPLHSSRIKERGFNQSELLSVNLGENINIPVVNDVLIRIRATLSQINLNRRERIENVKGAFAVENKEKIKDKVILLIDDVYTTGSTVKECAKMLKKNGAKKVIVLTLARGV